MRKGFYVNIYRTDGVSKGRNFFIPLSFYKFALIFIIGIILWSFFSTYFFITKADERRRLNYYRNENLRLKEKINLMEKKIVKIKDEISVLLKEQNKLRNYVDFEPLDENILDMPVGGFPIEKEKLTDLEERLDYLINFVEKQKSEIGEIARFLENNEKLRRTTPSITPVAEGYITSKFEWRMDPFTGKMKFHEGIDIVSAKGTPIFATADGIVKFSGWKVGYGLTVEIDHGNGFVTVYAHNEKNLVITGQRVRRGDVIALMGATGKASGVHVHYEVRLFGKPVNPLLYIIPDNEFFD